MSLGVKKNMNTQSFYVLISMNLNYKNLYPTGKDIDFYSFDDF